MFNSGKGHRNSILSQILFCLSISLAGQIFFSTAAFAQAPQPSPTPDKVEVGGFQVKSSIEIGGRYRSLEGSENKYRSDLNYKSGVRVFNSSFSMEDPEGKNRLFDSLLVNVSGWGADPSGSARVNLEKTGGYRFTSNLRNIKYFNKLNNHALGQHTQDTQSNMGDFDLTIFPQSEKLRATLGYSFSRYTGPGVWTVRSYRDDLPISSKNEAVSNDFRGGLQGKLAGFNLSFTQGYRFFRDRTNYQLLAPTPGNNQTDPATFATFTRKMPVRGEAFFSVFDVNRTFAKKFDVTGRIIYSSTHSRSSLQDRISGRDNNNNVVVLDSFDISARAKRPQTRADIGATYRVTNNFTLSNTFSFDQFAVNGDEDLFQTFARLNPAGTTPLPTTVTRSAAYTVNSYRRFTNLVEGDYQFSNRVSFHLGYRYTRRRVEVTGFDNTLTSAPSPSNPRFFDEIERNSTHTIIAGMKIKPTNWWVLFWDVENGTADNVFARIENYEFTNFRIRNRMTFKNLVFTLTGISKDNTNPARTDAVPPVGFGPIVKSRTYSGTADWSPVPELSFSTGYTYSHQTAKTPIFIFAPSPNRVLGRSEYYVRDHFAYLDVVINPAKWVSLFGSYRISKDFGQGDRPLGNPYPLLIGTSTTTLASPQIIVNSYPMQFQSPEVRAAFRLTKNIDWNIGYQYYAYREKFQRVQDYKAHLPYTSFTFYFGGADR